MFDNESFDIQSFSVEAFDFGSLSPVSIVGAVATSISEVFGMTATIQQVPNE